MMNSLSWKRQAVCYFCKMENIKFIVEDANVFVQEDVVMMLFRDGKQSFYIEDDLTNNKPTADNYLLELNKKKCNGGIKKIEVNSEYLKIELNENAQQKLKTDFIELEMDLEKFSELKKELRVFAQAYKISFQQN